MNTAESKVKTWSSIPQEAFRYFPRNNEIKEGSGSNYIRRKFESGQRYQSSELQQLEQLNNALRNAGFRNNSWFDDANKLRFLQANKYSISKTVKSITQNSQWRAATFPIAPNKHLNDFLGSGTVYICGRDAAYRPILVIDIGRFNLENSEIQKTQFLAQVLGTTFQFMLNEMLIEGQIQNYVLLINLNSISAISIGGLLKKLLQFTNNAYRSRLFVSYITNTTTSISFLWRTFKGFLSQNTVKKINFCDGNVPQKLFEHTHPSQVQKRFGGKMPDINSNFFPFQQRSNNYLIADQNKVLVPPQTYKQYYKDGVLNNRKICKQLVQQPPEQPKVVEQTVNLELQSTYLTPQAARQKVQKQRQKIHPISNFDSSLMSGFLRTSNNKVTGSLIDQLPIKNMNSIRTYFQETKYIAMKKKYYESV